MQLRKLTVLSILFLLPALFVTQVIAQPEHFEWENTDVNMSIILRAATLDGESLGEGDEIGMFTAGGVCAGASQVPADFPDEQMGLSPWQAEAGEDNGFAGGDVINFVYWDQEADEEWAAATDNIIAGDGDDDGNLLFAGNGFAVITLAGNRGEPVPEMVIDADILENGHDFGTIRVNQDADWVFDIGNTGRADLVISDLSVDSDHFSVNFGEDIVISPEESAEVTVMFEPSEEGEFDGTLSITWNDPDEGEPVAIDLTGVAEPALPPTIMLDPDQLNYGNVIVDEGRASSFQIFNEGDETLVVSSIAVEDEAFETNFGAEVEIPSGEAVTVIVTFTPIAEEVYSSDVIITSNDPDNEEVSVHVVGRGVAEDAPPEIGVAEGDEEFFFGWVITGEDRTWRFILLNNGVGDLHVRNMEIDDDAFSVDFNNEVRLRSGDRLFTDVTFAPEEDGIYEAVLTIISDDPDNDGLFTILLGGVAGDDQGTHFQWAGTENNSNILALEVTLDGESLVEGDEIGLFTQAGMLAGGGLVQDDGRAGMVAVGDEEGTEIIDGFVEDEQFRFLVWDADQNVEAWGVAEFLQGPEAYVANGFTLINLVAESGDPAGQISLDRDRHFFGQVEIEDDMRDWVFTITNVGIGDLTIESIDSDMNEYTTDFGDEAVTLEPEGGSMDITVVFIPVEERRFIGRLAITSDDPRNDEIYVDLIGDGVVEARNPGLEFNRDSWFFGVTPVDVERSYTLVITSSGGADLELQGFGFEGDDVFSAEFPDQNPLLEPGETFELDITFLPNEEREFAGVFTLETNLIEEEAVTFPVSGFGRVSDDHFMHLDTGIDHLFTISSAVIITAQDNNVPLYPGDEIAVLTPIGLIAGHVVIDEDNQFNIGLAAYADDPDNDVLVGFENGDEFSFMFWDMSTENEIDCEIEFIEGPEGFSANGETEINLTADAAEEEPLILVEPMVLQFPPTFVDEMSEEMFTVSNIGGANLTLEGFESDNEEFSLDLDNRIVLEPGGSVELAATFTPSAASGFEGTISIMSDDPHVPSFMVHPVGIGSDHDGYFLFGVTDVNHSVIINADIGGVDPSAGDEVGVFTADGLCAGSTVYDPDVDFGLGAWGDEADTELLVEGFTQGQEMTFLFYDESQDRVYEPEVEVANEEMSLDWTPNGFTVINLSVPDIISIVQVASIEVGEGEDVNFVLRMSVDEGNWDFTWTNEDDFDNIPDGVFTSENNEGTFDWQTSPNDPDDAGEYNFTFEATDGELTDQTSVSVTVIDVNQDPEIDAEYLAEIIDEVVDDVSYIYYNEDEIIDWTFVLSFDALLSDPDGDQLLLGATFPGGAQDGFRHRRAEVNGENTYEIQADENWTGEIRVQLFANDQRGERDEGTRSVRRINGANPDRDVIVTVDFTIVVLNLNDNPVFTAPDDADDDGQADDVVQGTEDEELVIEFSATDEEDDQDENVNLVFTLSDRDGLPDEGPVFVDNGDGTASFTWTPTFEEAGQYNPIFTVTDSDQDDPGTDVLTVTIEIDNVNQPPRMPNPIADLTEENAIFEDADRFEVADLNDVFDELDDDDALVFEIRESPDELQVLLDEDTGILSIQPMENFHTANEVGGLDELLITVAANDGMDAIAGSFMVSVSPVNDVPADFAMLSPENGLVIAYADSMSSLDFSWEEAVQVEMELDTVSYIVEFWVEGAEDNRMRSPELEETTYDGISIDSIAAFIFGGFGMREEDLVVLWQVLALDDTEDSLVASNATFSFTIPALGVNPDDQIGVPTEFFMSPAYPNPFNMETTVKFGIPQPGRVSITVWDMHGRQVAEIVNTQLSAGNYSVVWNANGLTSGIYMIRMHSGNFNKLQKSVLVR